MDRYTGWEIERPTPPSLGAWIGIGLGLLAMVGVAISSQPSSPPVMPGYTACEGWDSDTGTRVSETIGLSCALQRATHYRYVTYRGAQAEYAAFEPVVIVVDLNADLRIDDGVNLSKASEDRLLHRLQQWLDRNEANRPVPVFRVP